MLIHGMGDPLAVPQVIDPQNTQAAAILAGGSSSTSSPEMVPLTPVLVGVGLLFGWAVLANMHGAR
jgi:hypothetical protein